MLTPKSLQDIAIKASTVWSSLPREHELSWQQGNLRMNFLSAGDTIPWEFVKELAERFWEAACMQLTDLVEVIYMDEAQRIAVKIWVDLVERSSEASNEGVREGSVPSITSP